MTSRAVWLVSALLCGTVCHAETLRVVSPDGSLTIGFETDAQGLRWTLSRNGKTLVEPSRLGLVFAAGEELSSMKVLRVRRSEGDSAWTTQLYRRGTVRDRYREMAVDLEETEARAVRVQMGGNVSEKVPRRLSLVFRAYDEGAAFRYVIPKQSAFDGFELLGERTEWRFPGKCDGWFTSYKSAENGGEEVFVRRPMSEIRPDEFIGMPATVSVAGQQVALCEAALVNWAGLYYRTPRSGQPEGASVLESYLTPLPKTQAATEGSSVIRETPAASPWRVMICADTQLDLLKRNDIIVNLNPPPEEGLDFSWVKPGASSWDWWVESNNSLSTDVTLKLVDFAAEMGWLYHTIDGGWYGFARRPNHGPNVKLEPRKGFDLERIVEHAKAKEVGIWVWIHWEEIDDVGIEETFSRLEKWGVKGVKTDFLSRQDQWIVNWYERVCRAAARHRIMVNFHGAFKPTGTERTWPNNLTREGILGNEMNIFTKRITPEHCATLPFTRFLVGPGDFTPGSFANVYSKDFVPQVKKGHRYGDETDRCPHWAEEMGTRAHAIAQCIAFDSGLTTLCDWPERYRDADGIEALRKLPTTWKSTTPLAGACGEHYAVLRETHDGRFYFAAFSVKRRTVDLDLGFLGDGKWKMTVFADDPRRTPSDAKAIAVETRPVGCHEKISFVLCDEGGAAAVFFR